MKRAPSNDADDDVIDDPEMEDFEAPIRYAVTCYGADPDVESLVKRIKQKEIIVPEFQRSYVWKIKEASRFIESLLLGLPVPGIFMAKERRTNKMLIIDGQQRLKTLQFFYEGFFNPKQGDSRQKVFRLVDVHKSFVGKTYDTLNDADRRQLDAAIIHATIVKQDTPADDDTSIYHIFARLNSGGQKLTPQEIRIAAYHGPLMELIQALNAEPTWRSIFGKPSLRLKDHELILRFFAFYHSASDYSRPMGEFLNSFASKNQDMPAEGISEWRDLFLSVVELVHLSLGTAAFRPEGSLNAAVFDSVMVGLARRLSQGSVEEPAKFRTEYEALLKDTEFRGATIANTADEGNVALRIRRATHAFENLK